jgi:hypothetical protein
MSFEVLTSSAHVAVASTLSVLGAIDRADDKSGSRIEQYAGPARTFAQAGKLTLFDADAER